MAYTLPDGSTVSFSVLAGVPALVVTEISKAATAVAKTEVDHALEEGAEVLLIGSWENASNRIFRVGAGPVAKEFKLAGLDTTSTFQFPEGASAGRVYPIADWTPLEQVLSPSSSGGEQQFATVDPLSSDPVQLPSSKNPVSITIPMGDDVSLPGQLAWKKVSEERGLVALKVEKPNREVSYWYGYASVNDTPTMTKGQVSSITATFSPQGRITRYPRVGA